MSIIITQKNNWIKLIFVGESMDLSLSDTHRWVKEHPGQPFWCFQVFQSKKSLDFTSEVVRQNGANHFQGYPA